MIKYTFEYIIGCFKPGKDRTQKLKRNVAWSTIIKIGQMLIELMKVPILLSYLDTEKYGVWLTIVSILLWTNQFDLGLGSGLKYKLTESIAYGNKKRGKDLVSTAYVSMSVIMLVVFIIVAPVFARLDWNSILNVYTIECMELVTTILSVFFVFVLQFVLQLVSVVLKADQRSAISDIFKPLGSVISLGVVLTLGFFSSNSLLYASLAMSLPYILVLLFANIYYFFKDYQYFSPSLQCFDKGLLKDIYSLGLKYFLSQFAALVVFSTANVLLANMLGPKEVAVYGTARTYYTLMLVFINMISIPFIAPITEAYIKNDFYWIKRGMNKLKMISFLLSIMCLLMLLFSNIAFRIWVGDKIIVPFLLGIILTICTIIDIWGTMYISFLAGVGKLNVRVWLALFKIVTFIPLAIFFIELWGIVGIVIATILINALPNLVFSSIQYRLLISNKAKGIWNR